MTLNTAAHSIATAILTCSGPFLTFCTVRLSQSIFSGKKRPVASTVAVEIMGNLAISTACAGFSSDAEQATYPALGKVVLVDKTTVFYKCTAPIQVEKEALGRYTVDDA